MLPYLVATAIPLILLVGFLTLVHVEARTGRRLVAGPRHALDRKVAKVAFIARHVDWGAFLSDLARTSTERVLHDVAHAALRATRLTERTLTRVVRTLRARRDQPLFPLSEEQKPSRIEAAVDYVRKIIHRSRK